MRNSVRNLGHAVGCPAFLQNAAMDLRSLPDKEWCMARQVGYIIGSLRKDSYNRKLANALVRLGPPDFNFKELRIGDLPLFDQDEERSQAPEVQRLKSELRAVDA